MTDRQQYDRAMSQCGYGSEDARDRKSPRVLYAIAFNMTVIAIAAALAAGGRMAYVWWATR